MDCSKLLDEIGVFATLTRRHGRAMSRINAGRVLLGGVVAALVFFVGDGAVNGGVLNAQWSDVLKIVGMSSADEAFHNPAFFAVYDLVKGMAAIWLYSAIRPRFGPGFETAIIAALFVWILVLPVPMIGLLPMRFFSVSFAAEWAGLALIPIVVGTLVGAWLYREDQ
jgi:hypothetical protein